MRRFHLATPSIAFLLLALLDPFRIAQAAPTVGELLSVCDRAFERGNSGQEAAACEWYAFPCACKFRDQNTERWCVPESEPIETIVRKVVAELRRHADGDAPTDRVVPEILAKAYPCR